MALQYYWSITGSVNLKLQHGRFITFHFYHDVAHSLAHDYSKLNGYIWDLTTLMAKIILSVCQPALTSEVNPE
jgi:hypothetical protein